MLLNNLSQIRQESKGKTDLVEVMLRANLIFVCSISYGENAFYTSYACFTNVKITEYIHMAQAKRSKMKDIDDRTVVEQNK